MAPQALDGLPREATRGRTRSVGLAAALSILPGLGQVYNRQLRKALFFFLASVLTIATACYLIVNGRNNAIDVVANQGASLYILFVFGSILLFLVLLVLGLAFWASSIVDARRSAQELNRGDLAQAGRWWFFRL